tara:strand:- start:11094 stop:11351 length:258 start_codon:yes stop_codon:yes gene_type:complete
LNGSGDHREADIVFDQRFEQDRELRDVFAARPPDVERRRIQFPAWESVVRRRIEEHLSQTDDVELIERLRSAVPDFDDVRRFLNP